ncbi:thioredoxin [bacterium]|nr:thioredoxin [bacterium]
MAVTNLAESSFEDEIKNYKGVAVVDFWAPWCGPCTMVSPIIDELSDEMSNVKFCKVNVDEAQTLSEQFDIMSIPAVFIFKDGEVMDSIIGAHNKESYKEEIGKYL